MPNMEADLLRALITASAILVERENEATAALESSKAARESYERADVAAKEASELVDCLRRLLK